MLQHEGVFVPGILFNMFKIEVKLSACVWLRKYIHTYIHYITLHYITYLHTYIYGPTVSCSLVSNNPSLWHSTGTGPCGKRYMHHKLAYIDGNHKPHRQPNYSDQRHLPIYLILLDGSRPICKQVDYNLSLPQFPYSGRNQQNPMAKWCPL